MKGIFEADSMLSTELHMMNTRLCGQIDDSINLTKQLILDNDMASRLLAGCPGFLLYFTFINIVILSEPVSLTM